MAFDLPTGVQKQLWETSDSIHDFLSRRSVLSAITVGPGAFLFVFITLVPIGWALVAGFFDIHAYNPEWQFVGLENFATLFSDPYFYETVWKGLLFSVPSTLIQLAFGTLLAILLNREFKGERIIRSFAFAPYLLPTAILGYMTLWMTNQQWGVVNQILYHMGIFGQRSDFPAWFSTTELVWPALIGFISWKYTTFALIVILARLQGIPDQQYEAAKMSGASIWQQFKDVTFPHIKSVLLIVFILRNVWLFNKFDFIWVLTEGGPGDTTTTTPVFAYRTAFQSLDIGEASAISVFLFAILVVVAVIYFGVFKPSEEVRVE